MVSSILESYTILYQFEYDNHNKFLIKNAQIQGDIKQNYPRK